MFTFLQTSNPSFLGSLYSHDCQMTAGPSKCRKAQVAGSVNNLCQRPASAWDHVAMDWGQWKDGVFGFLQWISSINIENTRLITTITSRGCDVLKKTSKGFVWQTLWCLHRTRIPFIALYLKPMLHSPESSRAPSVFQLDRFVSTMGASSGWRDACSKWECVLLSDSTLSKYKGIVAPAWIAVSMSILLIRIPRFKGFDGGPLIF